MDTCNKQETLPPHETTSHVRANTAFTNENRDNNMQDENTETPFPIANTVTGNSAYLNSTTLYDALPLGGDLDVINAKFTDTTSIIDDKQKNCCTASTVDTQTQYLSNVVQPTTQTKETKNMNIKPQSKLVDYSMSDSEDSNSDSDESLSDSESTSDNENDGNNSTKPNDPEQSVVRNNTEFRENVSSSDSTSEYESDSSTSFRMKGSDASWEHNNEPPVACLDYSDDEEERQARRMLRNRKQSITEANKTNSLERNKKFEKQMNDKNLLMNERYKNQQNFAARNKKKPDVRPPMMNAAVGPPPPHPWMLHNPAAPMPRPQFWSAPPYQFAYPPYAPLAMFPQLDVTGVPGPRQHFVPPIMAPAPPPNAVFGPPFNPNIPPPIMRPQPVTYFPKPRHPPWVPPMNIGVNVLQPPRGNFGNGSSYTQ